MTINDWLILQVKASRKNYQQIAENMGISPETFRRWVKKENEPTGFFAQMLLDHFGYEIRIDGKPYKLDELGRYVREMRGKKEITSTSVSRKINRNSNNIQVLICGNKPIRYSLFKEVVEGYGGHVEIKKRTQCLYPGDRETRKEIRKE